jgi:hypothetical protein
MKHKKKKVVKEMKDEKQMKEAIAGEKLEKTEPMVRVAKEEEPKKAVHHAPKKEDVSTNLLLGVYRGEISVSSLTVAQKAQLSKEIKDHGSTYPSTAIQGILKQLG